VADERKGDASARVLFERQHDPSRVLALSDGVFPILITLLVLYVHLPELSQGQSLNAALREIRPSFTAFVISFILAGMYWVGHRDLFALIRRADRGLVWLNACTCCRCVCCRSARRCWAATTRSRGRSGSTA